MRAIWLVLIGVAGIGVQAQQQPQPPRVSLASPYLSRAFRLEQAGNEAGAEKELREAAALAEPDGYVGAISLSGFLEKRRRLDELEAIYQSGFDRTKDRVYLAGGAATLARVGKSGAARKMIAPLAEAMKSGEKLSPEITIPLTTAWRTLGEYELALSAARMRQQSYRESLPANSIGDLRAYASVSIADLLEDMGRSLEAQLELELLADELPNDSYVLHHYSHHLAVHGKDLETALKVARKADALPSTGLVWEQDTIGLILIKMGRNEEAVDYLVKLWRAAARSVLERVRLNSARLHLALALAKRRDESPAMRSLLEALGGETSDAKRLEIDRLLMEIGE